MHIVHEDEISLQRHLKIVCELSAGLLKVIGKYFKIVTKNALNNDIYLSSSLLKSQNLTIRYCTVCF